MGIKFTEVDESQRQAFAQAIADYMRDEHPRWYELTTEQAVVETCLLLASDIGAAQGLIDVIGADIDLYGESEFLPTEG